MIVATSSCAAAEGNHRRVAAIMPRMFMNGLRKAFTRASKQAKLRLRWPPVRRQSNGGQGLLEAPNWFRVPDGRMPRAHRDRPSTVPKSYSAGWGPRARTFAANQIRSFRDSGREDREPIYCQQWPLQ